jgi:hypothetical protein
VSKEPIIPFQADQDGYGMNGLCPKCGKSDGILNYERKYFEICEEHQVFWPVGENLFSGWINESREIWEQNRRLLETYQWVQPVYPVAETCWIAEGSWSASIQSRNDEPF